METVIFKVIAVELCGLRDKQVLKAYLAQRNRPYKCTSVTLVVGKLPVAGWVIENNDPNVLEIVLFFVSIIQIVHET